MSEAVHDPIQVPIESPVLIRFEALQHTPLLREAIEQCVRKALRAALDVPFTANIAATTASELAANVYDHGNWESEVPPSFAMWMMPDAGRQVLRLRFANPVKDPEHAFGQIRGRLSESDTPDAAEQKFRAAVVSRALKSASEVGKSASLGLLMIEVGGHCKLSARLDGEVVIIDAMIPLDR